jgi:signal transduction histidine kinase/ligand-binding sensor domain-containing protein/DNA-binding response OmpR family regulator
VINKLKWLLLISTTSFFLPFVMAAQPQLPFRNYTTEDGLSNSRVRAFLQDKDGFTWVGTAAGLNRFDGYRFTVFEASGKPEADGLYHSGVLALLEDQLGHLWVGTKSGLQLMNRQQEQFFPSPSSTRSPFQPIGQVMKLLESSEGDVWVGAVNGLFRISQLERVDQQSELEKALQKGAFQLTAHALEGTQNRIWSLEEDRDGRIWVGTNAGLTCFDLKKQQFIPLPLLPTEANEAVFSAPVHALEFGKEQQLWIGTEQGLYKLDIQSGQCQKYPVKIGVPGFLQNEFVTELEEDDKGRLWVGTDGGGLSQLDPSNGRFVHYRHVLSDPSSIADNNVEALYLDPHQGIWVGTHKGVSYYNMNRKAFQALQAGQGENAISPGAIEAACVTADGRYWLGIDDGGINIYDPKNGKITYLSVQNGNLIDNDVVALMEDRNNNIWIGSWGGGLSILNPDGQIRHLLREEQLPEFIRDPFVWTFLEDEHGNIWIGTVNNGLVKYQPKDASFTLFREKVPGSWVKDIAQDKQGKLWFLTNEGLFEYDTKNQQAQHVDLPGLNSNNATISLLYPGEDGSLWLGMQQGLVSYHPKGELKIWDQSHGMADSWVKSIAEDAAGQLWLGTGKGISKFTPDQETFINYGAADVLLKGEFTRAAAQAEDRSMLFGNIDGAVLFHPDRIKSYPLAPKVALTDFHLFNKSVPIDGSLVDSTLAVSPLKAHISYTKNIQLKHWQNYLSFEFAALDYLNPSEHLYKYRLKGLQDEWIEASPDHRIASFTDLSPGTYTFQVMAGNADGVWNEQPAEVRLYLSPPWWQSWWAYTLYALLIAGATFIALRIFKNRLELQAQVDFNQREAQRLKELDQFKSRLYTSLTHEFRTPLTVILGMTEQIRTAPKKHLEQGTRLIENNGRSLLRLINQLLDLSKLEDNALQLQWVQSDIISYLRYITASFQTYANGKNLSLRFLAQPNELLMDYDPEQLQQVMYNLISNAVKFTPSGGAIVVRLQKEQDLLKIGVEDNGIGIDKEAQARIFDRFYQVVANGEPLHTNKVAGTGIGLAHTRELVKLMGGSINVDSELRKGTVFKVSLPITQNAPLAKAPIVEHWQPKIVEEGALFADASSDKPLLLIIEDNPDVVLYLKSCLSQLYRLDIAYNGKIGIAKALEYIPDLIISDIMMPEKDGYQVCDFLKQDERTSHIPLILLTAKADTDSRIAGLKRGADAYLSKPFHKQELLVRLEKLAERQKRMAAYFERQVKDTKPTSLPQPEEEATLQIEDAFIQKVRSIVDEHYEDENFALPDLCSKLGMSRSQLYRKMKALTNTTPSAFIRFYRLNAARKLLEEGGFSVSEVAWKVGYKDVGHFSRNFQEAFGSSPSKVND